MKQLAVFAALLVAAFAYLSPSAPTPLPPQAGASSVSISSETQASLARFPTQLRIPAIGLDAPIQQVGLDGEGRMGVPDGKTNNVGWYEYGTVPGDTGSAVLAAHVYAAFKKLRYLPPGSDIYLTLSDGETLHFVAEEAKLTKLEEVSGYFLFERDDKPRLNLITCAGSFVKAIDTYDHRLIVYAVLID